MEGRVEAAKVGELTAGEMKPVEAGDEVILLLNVGDELYAINDECTHQGCSLSEGSLEDDVLECSCHGSMFNVRTGDVQNGPAENPVPTYSVQIEGGTVYVGPK